MPIRVMPRFADNATKMTDVEYSVRESNPLLGEDNHDSKKYRSFEKKRHVRQKRR